MHSHVFYLKLSFLEIITGMTENAICKRRNKCSVNYYISHMRVYNLYLVGKPKLVCIYLISQASIFVIHTTNSIKIILFMYVTSVSLYCQCVFKKFFCPFFLSYFTEVDEFIPH